MLLTSALLLLAPAALARAQGSITDYVPHTNQTCPPASTPLLRTFSPRNQTLHPREAAYIAVRRQDAPQKWRDWVGDGSALGYDLSKFASLPNISISVSGGGYRAALYGAGVLSALDARNDSAKNAGTGGLLQVASYWSGLSGGSWLTGSLYMNDWPTVEDLVFGNDNGLSGWLLDLALATPDGMNIFNDKNSGWIGAVVKSVVAKGKAGFDTSITDTWARMISYHFLNGTSLDNFFANDTSHGAGQLWSRIVDQPSWQAHFPPFPIVTIDSRPVGSNATTTDLTPTVYEVTPLEFGSWDPSLCAMMNLSYVGTALNDGKPANDNACVTAFDQAGFVMGTSASLFNQMFDQAKNTLDEFDDDSSKGLLYALSQQVAAVRGADNDVASWPNPFQGIDNGLFQDAAYDHLELIDGGSNLENIPIGPMFVRARAMDLIVAIDGSFDTTDTTWPNGTSLLATSERLRTILNTTHQPMPPIPSSTDDFSRTGVSSRPTLFGCDPTQTPPEWPLVLYLPNSPPYNGGKPVTNTGTFKLSYTAKHTRAFIDQTHNNTLAGFLPNTTQADPNWPRCLQCAALDRARLHASPAIPRSAFCSTCFAQYCFDAAHPPSKDELPGRDRVYSDPDPQGAAKVGSFLSREKGAIIGGSIGGAVLIAGLIGGLLYRNRVKKRRAAYARIVDLHADGTPEDLWQMDEPAGYDGQTPYVPEENSKHTPYVPEENSKHTPYVPEENSNHTSYVPEENSNHTPYVPEENSNHTSYVPEENSNHTPA